MITPAEVKQAIQAAGINRVDCRECSFCGYPLAYYIRGEEVFFDPGCDCSSGGRFERRDWSDLADWLNMQTNPEWQAKLRQRMGFQA